MMKNFIIENGWYTKNIIKNNIDYFRYCCIKKPEFIDKITFVSCIYTIFTSVYSNRHNNDISFSLVISAFVIFFSLILYKILKNVIFTFKMLSNKDEIYGRLDNIFSGFLIDIEKSKSEIKRETFLLKFIK